MAAATKHFETVALVGASEVKVTLDEKFAYQVRHTGVDAGGTDDANSALTAFLSVATGVAADMSEEDDKYPLMDGQSVEIGPGIGTLFIDSAADSDGILIFSRISSMSHWARVGANRPCSSRAKAASALHRSVRAVTRCRTG